jgi:hypothetical protein
MRLCYGNIAVKSCNDGAKCARRQIAKVVSSRSPEYAGLPDGYHVKAF